MKKYCVIGSPIGHSKSPQLHEAGFSDMHLEASFEKIEVLPEDLHTWLQTELVHYEGVAVTIPHKEKIGNFLHQKTEAAEKIGAVNTLFKKEGVWCGTNTDCIGALRAIQSQCAELEGKTVLVLGAGGASRAVVFALKTAGCKVLIWNRTEERAVALATEFEVEAVESLEVLDSLDIDIVVNATSVGLKSWESPLPESFWRAGQVAFDMVYDPLETRFLSEAENAGALTVTGDKMLCLQALEQFKLWHDIDLEPEVMEAAFFNA